MVRRGLRHILDAEPDLEVVAEAEDGRAALNAALSEDIDLAILDVAMPRLTGLQAAREAAKRRPELKVLILSMHDNEQYFFEALVAGASGYVLKSAADRDLIQACRAVMRGEAFVYPGAERTLIREYIDRRHSGEPVTEARLTPRETEVVKLVAEGYSNHEISEELVISEKTVQRHRANILGKLGMHDRVELTRYAIRCGLVEP
jgi:DNA-binding NarL/FixJ family response regulator